MIEYITLYLLKSLTQTRILSCCGWNDEKKNCTKGYPFSFCGDTTVKNGYYCLRRPNNGRIITKGKNLFTNENAVETAFKKNINVMLMYKLFRLYPACPIFSSIFIRVLIVHVAKTITTVSSDGNNVDEITNPLDARVVSGAEACAKIFTFLKYESSYAVELLVIILDEDFLIASRESL